MHKYKVASKVAASKEFTKICLNFEKYYNFQDVIIL